MITGTLQYVKDNKGFHSIKVNDVWYGADKKGFVPNASEGDLVRFEEFKTSKGYLNYKTQTFKSKANPNPPAESSGPAPRADVDKRISYFAALERAILFAEVAISAGALPLPKADKDKLAVIHAFVDETTDRYVGIAYGTKKVDEPQAAPADEAPAADESDEVGDDEEWS